jgi:hypothetical protein
MQTVSVVISHQTTTIYERANHRDDFEEIENDLEEEQVVCFSRNANPPLFEQPLFIDFKHKNTKTNNKK